MRTVNTLRLGPWTYRNKWPAPEIVWHAARKLDEAIQGIWKNARWKQRDVVKWNMSHGSVVFFICLSYPIRHDDPNWLIVLGGSPTTCSSAHGFAMKGGLEEPRKWAQGGRVTISPLTWTCESCNYIPDDSVRIRPDLSLSRSVHMGPPDSNVVVEWWSTIRCWSLSYAGWWFGCHQFYFPINIGLLIIPID